MGHYLGTHCTACGHRSRVYENLHPQEYEALRLRRPVPCLKCWDAETVPEVRPRFPFDSARGSATRQVRDDDIPAWTHPSPASHS